ncbi:MAG: DUF3810 domain-containing protein [Oscillospiraceae bacterium]|nr:DUF3810 domain-containing protein [Oscillospiraceae bacterium]
MELKERTKRGLAAIYSLCPRRHVATLAAGLIVLAHLLLRPNHALMRSLSKGFVRPLHDRLALWLDALPFSLAEGLICLAAGLVGVYIIYQVIMLFIRSERLKRVYITVITLLMAVLIVYGGFTWLWGTHFYGDDFISESGLKSEKISKEQLETVTEYFAALSNEYAPQVQRDERGAYTADRDEILALSPQVFAKTEKNFPCLQGPEVHAKGVRLSRALSYLDFTGFFFPFTGEANVNTDFPPSLFASTVAHELSHQRGVAKEQEANFTAVLACLEYGQADYCYSACLMAYTYLGNALYGVDYEAWEQVYMSLSEPVLIDFAVNRAYWKQFETPVQTVSNTVYEGLLYSYDQELGLKSYGACVDLLVNYYYDDAVEYLKKTSG